jgi:sugar phosphate isomerase/epimerase
MSIKEANIFASLFCAQNRDLESAIFLLVKSGFKNIELGGGCGHSADTMKILNKFQKEYGCNFMLHNYFPAPADDFSLNLASTNEDTWSRSKNLINDALEISEALGSDRYSIHAGFRLSPTSAELGQVLKPQLLVNRDQAWKTYSERFQEIDFGAKKRGVKLYVENNVFGLKNSFKFSDNPFLFTDKSDLMKVFSLGALPLLDFGHLKVSCNILGLDFLTEASNIGDATDYFHVSNNNGFEDENKTLEFKDDIHKILISLETRKKNINPIVTMEVYSGIDDLIKTRNILLESLH